MKKPRARVVGEEPNRDVVTVVASAHAYDVADDWVDIVVCRVPRTAHDMEGMPMQVNWVLICEERCIQTQAMLW